MSDMYTLAKEQYAKLGIDTEKVIQQLKDVSISIHCWQGDDVVGFDRAGAGAGDGIMTTGNYPGRARTPKELMADIDKVLSLVPGKHRINLHACYAIFEDGKAVDRDQIKPEHFQRWVDFAKERGLGIDFNPTMFSHPMVKGGLTLSSPDETVRRFWINHCKASREIAAYIGKELGTPCIVNTWIPDGFKDIPADRLGPRARLKESLDEIFAVKYDESFVLDCVESKVFGIGVESCTVGSHEFYLNYAAKNNKLCLLDTGHFHPTEVVSDKISSMLLFSDKVALHVSRPVRWDSDHVVIFDDELKEIAKEIVRNDALDRVLIALDFFDASINRIAAWTVGIRNMQKALAFALLIPHAELKKCQDAGDWTSVLVRSEEAKMYPYAEVWKEFCRREGVPAGEDLLDEVKKYEAEVLSNR